MPDKRGLPGEDLRNVRDGDLRNLRETREAHPRRDAQAEVLQVIQRLEQAINEAKPDLWLSLWDVSAPGFTIFENDNGDTLGPEFVEHVAGWLRKWRPARRQTWHTNKVVLLSPDLAYTASLRTENESPPDRRESRVTMVMRRTDDGWKIIQSHCSYVPRR